MEGKTGDHEGRPYVRRWFVEWEGMGPRIREDKRGWVRRRPGGSWPRVVEEGMGPRFREDMDGESFIFSVTSDRWTGKVEGRAARFSS